MNCHHDDLVLDERDIRLMRAYGLWVDTARKTYGPDWTPSDVDLIKSRLFWWIRSGHDPLPSPPPCAYSCPWYELVTEEGDHHVYDFSIVQMEAFEGKANISQGLYDVIEKVSETEYILGFGPYRFRIFRDYDRHVEVVVAYNGGKEEVRKLLTEEKESAQASIGWFITRRKDLEEAS